MDPDALAEAMNRLIIGVAVAGGIAAVIGVLVMMLTKR